MQSRTSRVSGADMSTGAQITRRLRRFVWALGGAAVAFDEPITPRPAGGDGTGGVVQAAHLARGNRITPSCRATACRNAEHRPRLFSDGSVKRPLLLQNETATGFGRCGAVRRPISALPGAIDAARVAYRAAFAR